MAEKLLPVLSLWQVKWTFSLSIGISQVLPFVHQHDADKPCLFALWACAKSSFASVAFAAASSSRELQQLQNHQNLNFDQERLLQLGRTHFNHWNGLSLRFLLPHCSMVRTEFYWWEQKEGLSWLILIAWWRSSLIQRSSFKHDTHILHVFLHVLLRSSAFLWFEIPHHLSLANVFRSTKWNTLKLLARPGRWANHSPK